MATRKKPQSSPKATAPAPSEGDDRVQLSFRLALANYLKVQAYAISFKPRKAIQELLHESLMARVDGKE